jgi:protein SHQ1
LPSPETTPVAQRKQLREEAESSTFDVERYMLDYLYGSDDTIYQSATQYTPWWSTLAEAQTETGDQKNGCGTVRNVEFTEEENKILRELPNKEYLVEDGDTSELLAGLVTIIFAYCYDFRTTEGEHSSESGWTLCKLSPLLSWLDTLSYPTQAMEACIRRALIFPYIRRYDLATLVARDMVTVFKLGKRAALRCLMAVKQLLEKEDHLYLLNTLYVLYNDCSV